MSIYYFTVERGVYAFLTSFKSDSVADAETHFRATTLVNDTDIVNAMYPPTLVHKVILDLERVICLAICQTEGHPRRVNFRVETDKTHLDALPSSVGGIGSVFTTGGEYLLRREPDVVMQLRNADGIIESLPTYTKRNYWAFDGGKFYCTVAGAVKMETFDPQFAPVDAFTDYDLPFVIALAAVAKLPEEFELAWVVGAAGILAAKVGTFPEEAANYQQMFQQLMEQHGVKLKLPLDFNANEG